METGSILTDSCLTTIQQNNQADSYNALVGAYRILKDRYNKLNTEHQIMSRVLQQVLTEDQLKQFLTAYTEKVSKKSKKSSLSKHSKNNSTLDTPTIPVAKPRSSRSSDKISTNQSSDAGFSSNRSSISDDSDQKSTTEARGKENKTINEGKHMKNDKHPTIIEKVSLGNKSSHCSLTDALEDPGENKPEDIRSLKITLRKLIKQSDDQAAMLKISRSVLLQQAAILKKLTTVDKTAAHPVYSTAHRQALEEGWTMLSPNNS